jgi:hypothetical protein
MIDGYTPTITSANAIAQGMLTDAQKKAMIDGYTATITSADALAQGMFTASHAAPALATATAIATVVADPVNMIFVGSGLADRYPDHPAANPVYTKKAAMESYRDILAEASAAAQKDMAEKDSDTIKNAITAFISTRTDKAGYGMHMYFQL